MNYFDYLKNPFVLGILIGLIAVLLTYLDTKFSYNNKIRDNSVYMKIFFITFSLVVGVIYITTTYLTGSDKIKMSGGTGIESGDKVLNTIADDIMKNMPLDLPEF